MKVGDKVRYVKSGALDWEEVDEADADGLQLGDIVTIAMDTGEKEVAVIVEEGLIGLWISPLHFELVN